MNDLNITEFQKDFFWYFLSKNVSDQHNWNYKIEPERDLCIWRRTRSNGSFVNLIVHEDSVITYSFISRDIDKEADELLFFDGEDNFEQALIKWDEKF